MPTARSEMPAVAIDGVIYVPGGFGGLSRLEAYDVEGDVWTRLADMPQGRHHLMAAAHEGRLYVFGGASSLISWAPTDTVWVYDPDRDDWQMLSPLPEARHSGAAISLGGYIYIVGGVGESGSLLRYDPDADLWSRLATLEQRREHIAVGVLDGEIYAIGGRWEGSGELRAVEIFDPASDQWRQGPELTTSRAGFGATSVGDLIVVAGGEVIFTGDEALQSVEILSSDASAWVLGPPLPVALHGVPMAADDGRVYLLGGSDRPGGIDNQGRVLSTHIADLGG
jgi:N-acetylneuraminic acid mutarotase